MLSQRKKRQSQMSQQPDSEAAAEYFKERAAIMEHDGGLSREEAEIAAIGETAIQFGWHYVVN